MAGKFPRQRADRPSKRTIAYRGYAWLLMVAVTATCLLAGCGQTKNSASQDGGADGSSAGAGQQDENVSDRMQVVTSNFALYDFARQVGGDYVEVTMLLSPGADSHSYEPTPKNMIDLEQADVFLYIGGESEGWVETMLSAGSVSGRVLALMDTVEPLEEEELPVLDGADSDDGAGAETDEYDEHIWTSPVNAMTMCQAIGETFAAADPVHADAYEAQTGSYVDQLSDLDATIREVVAHADRKELIFADRFPFLYFVKEYGLTYYAAFPGCSESTEASARDVAALVDRVETDGVPVVLHIELSNEMLCTCVAEETGAATAQLTACHNISAADFRAGKTYLDYMYENVEVLKEALGCH